MLEIDLTYPRSYEVEEFRNFPSIGKLDVPLIYIPQPKNRPEHNGLWLRFTSAGAKSWVGVFAFGYPAPPAFSRVVSSPDQGHAFVVAEGAGYLVAADDPQKWEKIRVHPILDVRAVPERNLLIVSDFTRLAAYGNKGLLWTSPRVCWDQLKIAHVTGDTIEGTGYDPVNRCRSDFVVDLQTGRSLLPPPVSTDGRPVW